MPRSYRVRWTQTAEQDLEGIIDYIARDSTDTALRVLAELRDGAATLSETPQRGRVVPELLAHGIPIYRELIIPPWRLVYRTGKGEVFVLALFDSRRNLEDILLDRLTR